MSWSRQKTSISGITSATTEKQEKREANRRLRRLTRARSSSEDESPPLPILREVSDLWAWPKDGKTHFSAKRRPDLIRK